MVIEKQVSRLIITDYTTEEHHRLRQGIGRFFKPGYMSESLFTEDDLLLTEASEYNKLHRVMSGEDFQFFFEIDGKVYFPSGTFQYVRRMFPLAKVIETKPWRSQPIKWEPEKLPDPRNKMQADAITYLYSHSSYTAATLSPGTGKAEPYSRKIPTPNGWKRMGDLRVGDLIFDRKGHPTRVIQIHEQGKKNIYEIRFNDGRRAYCCKDHLWNVKSSPRQQAFTTKSLGDMIKDFKTIRGPLLVESKYRIPVNDPVHYTVKNIPIDPWVIGCFISNGHHHASTLTITSKDEEIPNRIAKLYGFKIEYCSASAHIYSFMDQNGNAIHTKEFFQTITEMEDELYSGESIPELYKFNSPHIRTALVRGMMDASGSLSYDMMNNKFDMTYSSFSPDLLKELQYVLWGLGFRSHMNKSKTILTFDIPPKSIQEFFSTISKEDDVNHASAILSKEDFDHLVIDEINFYKTEQARCIVVDNPEHLYLTEDFIVTHNTFMSSFVAFKLKRKTLIIVPTTNLKKQWADSLKGLFKVPEDRIQFVEKREDLLKEGDWFILLQQGVTPMNKDYKLEEYFQRSGIGTKIIDEAHLFFQNTMRISCLANFENNIHLTATFGRSSDIENHLFHRAFGDIPMFSDNATSWTGTPKYPQKKHVHLYSYNLNSGLTKREFNSMTSFKYGLNVMKYANVIFPKGTMQPTHFEQDILRIVEQVIHKITYGKMLFLFPTINASEKMAKFVKMLFPDKNVGALNSSHSRSENEQTMKTADIIVSTSKSSGTGLDIKGLSVCLTAEQYKSPILAEQIFGRLRVRDDGQDTYFYDITDLASRQLVNWRNARMDVMRKRAKTFHQAKGSNIKVLTETVDYLREIYLDHSQHGEYEEAMKVLKEMYYYV
jgi:superfamily II DNA or RNA helicase